MSRDWRESFHAFALAVAERLKVGGQSYQGRSFSAEPQALIGEIRDEVGDVAGSAFVLDCRLARVVEALEQASVTTAGETDRYTETTAPTSAGSRDADDDRRPMPGARDARHRQGQ